MASFNLIDGEKVLRHRTLIPGLHNLKDLVDNTVESDKGKAVKTSKPRHPSTRGK